MPVLVDGQSCVRGVGESGVAAHLRGIGGTTGTEAQTGRVQMIDEDSVRTTGQDRSAPPGGAVPIAVGPASGAGEADAAYGCYRAQQVPVDSDPLAQALHRAEVAEARIEETLCFLDQSTLRTPSAGLPSGSSSKALDAA